MIKTQEKVITMSVIKYASLLLSAIFMLNVPAKPVMNKSENYICEEAEVFATEPIYQEAPADMGGIFVAPDGKEYKYSYYVDVTATAYTHTGNPTYMGTVAEVGVVAVDPKNIALGSEVYVIGSYGDYGVCRAEDIGGGIKGARIDVFLDTEEECVSFGRRKMRAYVLEK